MSCGNEFKASTAELKPGHHRVASQELILCVTGMQIEIQNTLSIEIPCGTSVKTKDISATNSRRFDTTLVSPGTALTPQISSSNLCTSAQPPALSNSGFSPTNNIRHLYWKKSSRTTEMWAFRQEVQHYNPKWRSKRFILVELFRETREKYEIGKITRHCLSLSRSFKDRIVIFCRAFVSFL